MIARFSEKIVDWLVYHSEISRDEDQIEVYIYGLECFLNTAITVFILMIWAIITHCILETICWIISFAILRHHTGGFHAPTQFTCILCSSVFGISNYFVMYFHRLDVIDILAIFTECLVVCILYAPTDSKKLKLSFIESQKQKKISIGILIFGTLISLRLQNNLSNSVMYSFFCTCILILIKNFKGRHLCR